MQRLTVTDGSKKWQVPFAGLQHCRISNPKREPFSLILGQALNVNRTIITSETRTKEATEATYEYLQFLIIFYHICSACCEGQRSSLKS